MTHDRTPDVGSRIPVAWRKTATMLAAWVVAAVALGVPAGQASPASAEVQSAPAPKIIHSGPECLAGHGAAPAATTKTDRAKTRSQQSAFKRAGVVRRVNRAGPARPRSLSRHTPVRFRGRKDRSIDRRVEESGMAVETSGSAQLNGSIRAEKRPIISS